MEETDHRTAIDRFRDSPLYSPLNEKYIKETDVMKRLDGTTLPKTGFTLLELLIVLAILIVIIGILGTTVWSSYKKALIRAATVQVETTLQTACEDFKMDFKRYPTQAEGLYILADMDNPEANNGNQNGMMNATGMQNNANGMNNMNGMSDMSGTNNMNNNMTGMGDMSGMNNMNGNMTGMGDMSGMNNMNGMSGMNNMNGNMTGMNMQNNMAGSNSNYKRPKIIEPLVKEKDLYDPWNNLIKYEWPTAKGDGKRPAIWSCGPDGEDNNGEGDDIINWDSNDTSGQARMMRTQQANMQNNGMNNMNNNFNTGLDQNGMNNMNNTNNMNNFNNGANTGFNNQGNTGF